MMKYFLIAILIVIFCIVAQSQTTIIPAGIASGTAGQPAVYTAPNAVGSSPNITLTTLATTTNCAAAGSGANPSLVACAAAASGSFSCATNASTGTCVISTTAVTANSRIFIQPSSAEGTNLSVTCNTTSDTGLTAPRLASKSTSTSFTINLGTFATNPVCFNYWIVN